MKRIDILITRLYLEKVILILEEHNVSNFYISEIADSKTPGEERMGYPGIVPAQDTSHIYTFLENQLAKEILEALKLKKSDLNCELYISDIEKL